MGPPVLWGRQGREAWRLLCIGARRRIRRKRLSPSGVYEEATDEWVLNGTKAWITNGGIADIHVVVAVVDPELGSKSHASFVVPPNTPGLSQGQKYKKHGIRASHTAEVVLDDVRLPGSCLLGGKEKLDERLARVREGKKSNSRLRCKPSRQPARLSAPRRLALPAPPMSTRWSTPRNATPLVGPSS